MLTIATITQTAAVLTTNLEAFAGGRAWVVQTITGLGVIAALALLAHAVLAGARGMRLIDAWRAHRLATTLHLGVAALGVSALTIPFLASSSPALAALLGVVAVVTMVAVWLPRVRGGLDPVR